VGRPAEMREWNDKRNEQRNGEQGKTAAREQRSGRRGVKEAEGKGDCRNR